MSAPAPRIARELQPGDELTVNGSERVTVAEVTRRDSRWISNGVVHFIATNGHKYGLDALERLR